MAKSRGLVAVLALVLALAGAGPASAGDGGDVSAQGEHLKTIECPSPTYMVFTLKPFDESTAYLTYVKDADMNQVHFDMGAGGDHRWTFPAGWYEVTVQGSPIVWDIFCKYDP